MMVRQANHKDLELLKKGLKQLSGDIGWRYCPESAASWTTAIVSSKASRAFVGNNCGLIAVETPNLWAERRSTQICALWADEPLKYAQLIEECIEWFNSRKGSTLMYYAMPVVTDADAMLIKYGFEQTGSMLARRKYHGVVQQDRKAL